MFEIQDITQILRNISQFLFGSLAVAVSVYALFTKRKDVFKTELAKSQFIEIGVIRSQLSEIFFDVGYVHTIQSQLDLMNWSLKDFEEKCPEEWEQFQRYKENSTSLFYKIMTSDYYLLPEWVDSKLLSDHFELMEPLAPFTVFATGSKKQDDIEKYRIQIQELIRHLDVSLKKNA
jgi:hypothetical protein